ncbi:penicillin-binding protein 2 [Cysteiniphilum sp. QT6929]|uniref:peptidoglycan D,D-transpeptidase FtsI family protein n=1 Tax=Cysteiniphilum sp. QT6929 TaxID=2975055 RepID=UPI0024B356E8|nr:penicillin-binding protein 2 [Cysteiniphilum sp. QT6929]WHN65615.1 penicillin-binding protein 2 [Cysteiniphilum sp. QT6929]
MRQYNNKKDKELKKPKKTNTYNDKPKRTPKHKWRFFFTFFLIIAVFLVLVYRLFYLETKDHSFLSDHGQNESHRTIDLDATRGIIYDRNGIPLAVSTNLYKVILDIKVLKDYPEKYQKVNAANIDGLSLNDLETLISKYPNKQYYIAAQFVEPSKIDDLKALNIPGVEIEDQNRTYYPKADEIAPLIGFTNITNKGQDGLMLTYQDKLHAEKGALSSTLDGKGRAISFNDKPKHYHLGKSIYLTIDSNIQSFAYQALKKGVIDTNADSGAAVVVDPQNGEILALASYPSFNPNNFNEHTGKTIALQPVIETFEPGSTIKPFFISQALLSGKYTPDSMIDTNPGYYFLHSHRIRDDANFGDITLTQILEKSSNVGVSKVTLTLDKEKVYNFLSSLGFGQPSTIDFPRATNGYLPPLSSLSEFEFATLSFGYALSSSALQLAHAYTIFGNDGKLCPVSLIKPKHSDEINCRQVLPQDIAKEVLAMLQTVVSIHGTGVLANIPGFDVAGKTGTSHRVANGKFVNEYNAIFAGVAPVKNPRLSIVVWINNPKGSHFYQFGGVSAAPVFASIAQHTLQYMGVPYQQPLSEYELLNRNKKWLMQIIADN